MRFVIILLIVPFLYASSCSKGKNRLQSEKGKKVRFEIKTLQKKLGDCEAPDGACTQIDLIYPLVTEGVPAVKAAVNDTIFKTLIQNFTFETYTGELSQAQLERIADGFLLEWQAEKSLESEPNAYPGWEVTVTGEVGLHTSKVAVISLGTYSYAGGAHPNSYVTIFNFSLKNGRTLGWQDIVTDLEGLKKLAEKAFKAARDLTPDADLSEEGYFWGETFALPQNFELKEEGIYFWYNPYEAAAYSQGPTDFLLTYKELGELVRKDSIF